MHRDGRSDQKILSTVDFRNGKTARGCIVTMLTSFDRRPVTDVLYESHVPSLTHPTSTAAYPTCFPCSVDHLRLLWRDQFPGTLYKLSYNLSWSYISISYYLPIGRPPKSIITTLINDLRLREPDSPPPDSISSLTRTRLQRSGPPNPYSPHSSTIMSASMPIPKRKQHASSPATGSWSSSSTSSSWGTDTLSKAKVLPEEKNRTHSEISSRRPSLLGSSLARSEYTVINLGHDKAPRLVSGVVLFTSSPLSRESYKVTLSGKKERKLINVILELFIPSYADHDSHELEHKPDPVQDIVLTDEEAAAMLPQ
nr:hypothetical protein CFP56_19676 [Quercus suber]